MPSSFPGLAPCRLQLRGPPPDRPLPAWLLSCQAAQGLPSLEGAVGWCCHRGPRGPSNSLPECPHLTLLAFPRHDTQPFPPPGWTAHQAWPPATHGTPVRASSLVALPATPGQPWVMSVPLRRTWLPPPPQAFQIPPVEPAPSSLEGHPRRPPSRLHAQHHHWAEEKREELSSALHGTPVLPSPTRLRL